MYPDGGKALLNQTFLDAAIAYVVQINTIIPYNIANAYASNIALSDDEMGIGILNMNKWVYTGS